MKHIYVCVCVCVCVYIRMYIYIQIQIGLRVSSQALLPRPIPHPRRQGAVASTFTICNVSTHAGTQFGSLVLVQRKNGPY